jgi:hypothetical protein
MTTQEDIREWFREGILRNCSHMIVVCDSFDYEDYPVYVEREQICQTVYEKYCNQPMQRVMEIYDLDEDMEPQIKEKRAWSV